MSKAHVTPTINLFLIYSGIIFAFMLIVGALFYFFGNALFSTSYSDKEMFLGAILIGFALILLWPIYLLSFRKISFTSIASSFKQIKTLPAKERVADSYASIRPELLTRYGKRHLKKLNIYLLLGSSDIIEHLSPGLSLDGWQEREGTVLIWGGEVATSGVDSELVRGLKRLRRRRPLDGVIWLTESTFAPVLLGNGLEPQDCNSTVADSLSRYLHELFQTLGWRAPVWSWHLTISEVSDEVTAPAILSFPAQTLSPQTFASATERLVPALIAQGTQALLAQPQHTYLLTLARYLQQEGRQQLATLLAPFSSPMRRLPLAGLLFSAQPKTVSSRYARLPHQGGGSEAWQAFLAAQSSLALAAQPTRIGLNYRHLAQWGLTSLAVTLGVGMVNAYWMNRQLILNTGQELHAALDETQPQAARLQAHYTLQQTLGLLSHRGQTSVPFWLRFGVSQNQPLLDTLWPVYGKTLLPTLRAMTQQSLSQYLQTFAALPPESTEKATRSQAVYQVLKAYLMMGLPQKIEPDYFANTVLSVGKPPEGLSEAQWQTWGQEMLRFYARELPFHPEWQSLPDASLVSATRALLIQQITQRSDETVRYQRILQQASTRFAAMTLEQMTKETDAAFLFTSSASVPGVFTRKAWEEAIEPAINKAVEERREEIDWVLSDETQSHAEIAPAQLKQRLTEQYFADFSLHWLNFLNRLQWRQTKDLADTLDQLILMSDVRQSPVIALMNTLAYQGKTGRQQERLSDSVVASAKALVQQDKQPVISQKATFSGPLEPIFGPLLTFIEPTPNAQNSETLSLSTYLTRITRIRLKLQQVVNAPDPQAMSLALAQSIFSGKSVDLSETRDYGRLIAASLGQEWSGFGQTLLVQPMAQAWQQLLAPTAQGLNSQWQSAIVNDWNSMFSGRYPLKATQSEVSLPLLAQYLRPDSGRIQRFLATHLNGVLRQEGTHWVPDSAHAQGLTFNPDFLSALDTLGYLADVVFANGDARLYFELRPVATKGVMQSRLTLDKQALTYDNQLPQWQRFVWPEDTLAVGASLSWMSPSAGTRQYADYQRVWGWVRLLELAETTPYAGSDSSYLLRWTTQDGTDIRYVLRTEMGEGPLALLRLRDFVLPEHVFLTQPAEK